MVWGALIVLMAGCSGDPAEGSDVSGSTGDTGSPSDAPTFTRVKKRVLMPTCALTGCHAPGAQNGFVLAEGEEYEALVNVPSPSLPGEVLVIPGDPDGSYLIKKVTNAPGILDDPMPPPSGNIDPRFVQLLREWIAAGALDN